MNNVKGMTLAERAGRTFSRWLKSVVRLEAAVLRSLATAGIPRALVLALKWGVRVALGVGLLYFALVPALIILFLGFFLVPGGNSAPLDDEEFREMAEFHTFIEKEREARKPQQRDGHSGWGWYSHDDHALDIEHPDDFLR
ncbi:DUF3742 family protein [Paraburkholderia sp. Ac-20342]|uniref:DUF3742 family protein n=1 Tax=Paraburkholderia sp. Ac-20342 TaxID=2703889 RepID=UPI00197DE00D|nr:DUF3742 family protein [Paraburkholderia sp. Ac-20342]MBN3849435.1 DUF3742 family protein [Paraburkholderia sp. Ac-20342]